MILKNKKFIISAAGDGIGFSISKLIVQNGGKVYLTDIDQKKINKIKTTKQDKKRRCKDEASGMFAVFGHEVNFGYKKCDEWF